MRLKNSGDARRLLSVLAAAATVGGCGVALPSGHGFLTGHINADVGLCPDKGCRPTGGLVTVFNRFGHPVAHEHVSDGQSFSFVLPSGRYELNLGAQLLGRSDCAPPSAAVVSPGKTTRVDVHADCGVI
jgi:hypothetical protein